MQKKPSAAVPAAIITALTLVMGYLLVFVQA
jgi:hypothetical protein